jgi:hypothetical protein
VISRSDGCSSGCACIHAVSHLHPTHQAQELLAQEDPLLVNRHINDIRNVSVQLRDAYYTMRMGIDAPLVAGECTSDRAAACATQQQDFRILLASTSGSVAGCCGWLGGPVVRPGG